jgi:5'-nucleotidase
VKRIAVALAVALGTLAASVPVAAAAPRGEPVEVQLLALNDFHGNLEPPAGPVAGVDAGGVEYLATHVDRLRATNRNTLVASAGDLIGASPILSALFHDEPTVEAMNRLGLDLNAVGNHEFDDGQGELRRMQSGGCHPEDGCQDGTPFVGADFRFLAANVKRRSGRTLFPPYAIRSFEGERIAFVGMTLEATPSIVSPSGVIGLSFEDEAETVNALIPRLRARGAETVIVLLHEGGFTSGGANECPGLSGPIVDIVERTSDEVDLFVTGHTHRAYNCVVDGRPVTSAGSFGRLLTDIDLTIDRVSGEPTRIRAANLVVTRDVPEHAAQTALLARYRTLAAPIGDRVVGRASAPVTRDATPAGESALGDLVADAQLSATAPAGLGGARIAFMNPGGIRADLAEGEITYAEAFAVQPFGNNLVTLTLTGAEVDRLLELQWDGQASPRILQVSRGFSYGWDPSRPVGERVDPATITLDGAPLDPATRYRVTVNSFLADGGDGFGVLPQGTDRLGGVTDLDAFEAYLRAGPVAPPARDRIRVA